VSALPHSVQVLVGAGGLPMIRVDGPSGWAEIYSHGAHVTAWGPSGQGSVLWLSGSSCFDELTAIRGGIPVCFPWFGPLAGRPDAPRHGFARTSEWTFDGAQDDGHDVTVRFWLSDSIATRGSAWHHRFMAICTVVVGSSLSVSLEVTNTGNEEVTFEEALHTYLSVADVTAVETFGLEGLPFVDETRRGAICAGEPGPLLEAGEVDRAYFGAPATITVNDVAGGRAIRVGKGGSGSTVVWNPGSEGARATPDIDEEGWTTMLCIEASNIGPAAVRLEPGGHHTMQTTIEVGPLARTQARDGHRAEPRAGHRGQAMTHHRNERSRTENE